MLGDRAGLVRLQRSVGRAPTVLPQLFGRDPELGRSGVSRAADSFIVMRATTVIAINRGSAYARHPYSRTNRACGRATAAGPAGSWRPGRPG